MTCVQVRSVPKQVILGSLWNNGWGGMHNELKENDHVSPDSGLTRECQQHYVKPADHSEKRVGSKNSESKCKMRPVLDFLTAELWTTSCQYLHISYLCNWYLNHMFFTIPSSDRQVSPSSKYKIQPFQRYSCQFFLKVCMLWFNFKLCTISIFLHFMVCWFMIACIKK